MTSVSFLSLISQPEYPQRYEGIQLPQDMDLTGAVAPLDHCDVSGQAALDAAFFAEAAQASATITGRVIAFSI